MEYSEYKTIRNNPKLEDLAQLVPDIVYSRIGELELKLHILLPWSADEADIQKRPLIVFVQGSAWTFPNVNFEIPQLSEYARSGYIVATVTHRNCMEGHPAPAFLKDVKTAIRFLRAHADEYGIDTERVGIWGTSSGGNTALLVGLTGDDPRYKTDEYAEFSDKVNAVVDCFGPTDLYGIIKDHYSPEEDQPDKLFWQLCGGNILEHKYLLDEMSPLHILPDALTCPPMLLIHGDADDVVDFNQSLSMFRAMRASNHDAEMIRVSNAPHEGNFWSKELHSLISDYLSRKL